MKTKKYYLLLVIMILVSSNKISAQMTWNQACSFAGTSSSYIAIPNSTSLDITGSFTLEAWVNPVNAISPVSQTILQKRVNGSKGYVLFLSNGKVAIKTNNAERLVGITVLPDNQWSHIAGTFDVTTGTFTVYINGIADASAVVAVADPNSDNDSLLVGVGTNSSPFAGKMDEIRVWNKPIGADVNNFKNLSLGTNSGIYSGLVLSLTLQNSNPAGTLFSLLDWSGNNNNGVNKGATTVDLSNRPGNTISINECVNLDGTGDYLAAADNPSISPTQGITVEAWLYPRSFNANPNIFSTVIHKGNATGTNSDYDISISSDKLNFTINNQQILSATAIPGNTIIPLNQWTHVAFTYNGLTGFFQYFKNGLIQTDDTLLVGNIHDNADSLYIGGTSILQGFDGYADEVKITSTDLSYGEIGSHVYSSVNELNDPIVTNVVYNLDGGLTSNTDASTKLNFRGNAKFSNNASTDNTPVSPLTFSNSLNFQNGFYINNPMSRIPNTGTSGFMISDTINILSSEVISDVNVFVALNHTNEDNLIISLLSPTGTSVTMYSTSALINNSDNIVTVFDDQSDSSLASNKYIMYAPVIKPLTGFNSALGGINTSGKWKLRIQDIAAGDTGTLYGWGIQFNNQSSRKKFLSLTSLVQGFYNQSTNLMIPDTMRVYLRETSSPYSIKDSSKALLNSSGFSNFGFNNINDGVPYIIQLKHRNSVETWSNLSAISPVSVNNTFSPLNSIMKYDFTPVKFRAFGSNQIQVDSLPLVKFAIFGGDVNQDGAVDLSDLSLIDNASFNFVSGYVNADLTGDNFVDLGDLTIADNNAFNFVNVIRP